MKMSGARVRKLPVNARWAENKTPANDSLEFLWPKVSEAPVHKISNASCAHLLNKSFLSLSSFAGSLECARRHL